MKSPRLMFGTLAVVSIALVPSGSGALAPGELDIRTTSVDYEAGEAVEWTVDWVDPKTGVDSTDKVVVRLGGPHDLVADSVAIPRGWSVTYSDDGETYIDEMSSDVTHLKFTRLTKTAFPIDVRSVAGPDDFLIRNLIPQPVPAITTARNGGDGYIPMLAGDRIYGVWHHLPAGGNPEPHMVCIDTLTGKNCPNYPKVLGWQTSFNQGQGVFIDNRLYIKNRGARTHGVLCWNTVQEKSCGYTPIANLGPVTGTAGGDGGWDQFSSPVLHNGRLFFAGHDFRVYCFDPTTDAACADYGREGRATARFGEAHATTRRINDVMYHEGRMIFSLATSWADGPIPLGTRDTCFDLNLGAPCPDWGDNGLVVENAGTAYLFSRYDGMGKVIGFCHGVRSGAGEAPLESTVPCYDLNGKNRTTISSAQPFGQFRPYNVEEATIGTRTFFGRYSTFGAYCYDWATSAPCAGQYFDANGRSGQSLGEHFYGFVRRGECMIGLGHRGVFMSIDPVTGGSPCRKISDTNFIAAASSRYCGDTTYLSGWRLGLASDVSKQDFDQLTLSVTDGVTTVEGDALAGGIALNALARDRDLRVDVRGSVKSGADPWRDGAPALNLLYSGSSQFCFRTKAKKATAPIEVEAETRTDTESRVVVVDETPEGVVDETPSGSDSATNDEGAAQDSEKSATSKVDEGRLPETGLQAAEVLWWVVILIALGSTIVFIPRRLVSTAWRQRMK